MSVFGDLIRSSPVESSPVRSVFGSGASAFSPADLFAASEVGAVYDPSDLTSLYQTRTGGANVTAGGQTAAIMLDKSRMQGKSAAQFIADQPELLPAGAGDGTSLAGWQAIGTNAIIALSGGGIRVENGVGGTAAIRRQFSVQTGKNYLVTVNKLNGLDPNRGAIRLGNSQAAGNFINTGTTAMALNTGNGAYSAIFAATVSAQINLDLDANSVTLGAFIEFRISVKEIPGFHYIAPSDAARALYGREPITGRRNLLTWTEDFSNAAWSLTTATRTTDVSDHLGGTTAATLTATSANGQILQSVTGSLGTGTTYTGSIWLRRRTGTGSVWLFNPNAGGVTAVTLTASWQRFTVSGPGAASLLSAGVRLGTSGDAVDIAFSQIDLGTVATAYQRVDSALDVTEAGVASRHFLQPDGVDDWGQVLPVCNLGEVWSHVGGWRSDTSGDAPFATTNQEQSALSASGKWTWFDTISTQADLVSGTITAPHILTVEQASASALSARLNGAAGSTINPYDGSSPTRGLALFSRENDVAAATLAGRFYGGTWINRALTTGERRALEVWQAQKTGVAA